MRPDLLVVGKNTYKGYMKILKAMNHYRRDTLFFCHAAAHEKSVLLSDWIKDRQELD